VAANTKTWWQRIPSWLLWALAALAAVALLLFVLWVGPWLFTRHPSHGLTAEQQLKAKNDVRTTLVQAVAGLAVAGGAIVTYRTFRQTRNEQDRAYKLNQSQQVTETYAKAVEQLGHAQAPVRLGAMYSLERLAQNNPARRPTVVDVLCAYLRMPYTPPTPDKSSGRWARRMLAPGRGANEDRRRDAAQERQVRQTAQRLLAQHLRPPRDGSRDAQSIVASHEVDFWPGMSLDLTGATLVDLDLMDTSVVHATFSEAAFSGDANFQGATFSGNARFGEATFSGNAWFRGATFSSVALFTGATFSREAWFRGATFSSVASFGMAIFSGDASFDEATFFSHALFGMATFSRATLFTGADFLYAVSFDEATFSNVPSFDGAHVLRPHDPKLHRVWPNGWTVRPDADHPSRGTLVHSAAKSH
jgi:hypothetical protein